MGRIEEYRTGRILEGISKALQVIDSSTHGHDSSPEFVRVKQKIREFEPVVISRAEAGGFIQGARKIAIGERICRALHPGSEFTESVFLDELADAMIEAGHGRPASHGEALRVLEAHPGHPLVMSKVSGRYLEICSSTKTGCVFWIAERNGIRCMKRNKDCGK
jgi:hypothetical protein